MSNKFYENKTFIGNNILIVLVFYLILEDVYIMQVNRITFQLKFPLK